MTHALGNQQTQPRRRKNSAMNRSLLQTRAGNVLVLHDAQGDFDRNFDWWKGSGKHRLVEPQLPFENGRSDLLTGSGSRLDIQNINLLATSSSGVSRLSFSSFSSFCGVTFILLAMNLRRRSRARS